MKQHSRKHEVMVDNANKVHADAASKEHDDVVVDDGDDTMRGETVQSETSRVRDLHETPSGHMKFMKPMVIPLVQ